MRLLFDAIFKCSDCPWKEHGKHMRTASRNARLHAKFHNHRVVGTRTEAIVYNHKRNGKAVFCNPKSALNLPIPANVSVRKV